MAINKRKVLEAARKYAQKGAKQKALKEYNRLVQGDPRDAKLLLEVGDAYRRWGQVEEAIAQYNKVANQYKQDGFDARAVAVLKQILNLDPKRHSAHVTLAELYQRMGLDSDAVAALQTAADGYYKDGNQREALALLRKMAALDPTNTTSRLKVADLLKQEGMEEEAIAEYEEVVAELARQGSAEQVTVVQERLHEMQPERADILLALTRNLNDLGLPQRAEPFALRALQLAPEPDNYELLCGIYKSLGNEARLEEVTRELAALYRDRGDEDHAREVMQRLPAESVLGAGAGLGADRSECDDEPLLGDDELLADDDFLVTDDEIGIGGDEEFLEFGEPDTASGPEPDEEDLPEGDPDQLFAEASVYLRYGKREQAIASLKGILVQEPARRGVLEKLGEVYAEMNEAAEAVRYWLDAAGVARGEGDAAAFGILRDRIAVLDPEAASGLGPSVQDESQATGREDDVEFELELDDCGSESPQRALGPATDDTLVAASGERLDLDVEAGIEPGGGGPSDAGAPAVAEEGESEAPGGIDLDSDGRIAMDEPDLAPAAAEEPGEAAEDEAAIGSDGIELDVDASGIDVDLGQDGASVDVDEIDLDASGVDIDIDVDVTDADQTDVEDGDANRASAARDQGEVTEPTPSGSTANGQSTMTTAQIREDLEEAEFYVQQGLRDEAEGIYRRILALAPGHPSALLRLGELAASRGEDPSEAADRVRLEIEQTEAPTDPGPAAAELDDETTEPEVEAVVADSAASGALIGEDSTEVETFGSVTEPALEFEREPVMAEPERVEVSAQPDDDSLPATEEEEVAEDPEVVAAESDDEASFDLVEALADVFGESDEDGHGKEGETSSVLSSVDDGFESIFADFKKGVSAALEEGDFDTRYDLGIAYHEMGLYDDAIAEFRVCLDCPSRHFESLHMMGLCALDVGRFPDAVSHLEQALATPDLADERQAGIYFDLGRAHQASGDLERARSAFERVQQIDADFPELAEHLATLEEAVVVEEASLDLQDDEEEYESFDDLMSGEADDTEPEVAEAFESFDDVLTEVEAVVESLEQAAVESPPPDEPEPDPPPSKRARRKKKISFV